MHLAAAHKAPARKAPARKAPALKATTQTAPIREAATQEAAIQEAATHYKRSSIPAYPMRPLPTVPCRLFADVTQLTSASRLRICAEALGRQKRDLRRPRGRPPLRRPQLPSPLRPHAHGQPAPAMSKSCKATPTARIRPQARMHVERRASSAAIPVQTPRTLLGCRTARLAVVPHAVMMLAKQMPTVRPHPGAKAGAATIARNASQCCACVMPPLGISCATAPQVA